MQDLLTPERIAALAEQFGKSGAQKNAISVALDALVQDETLTARPDEPELLAAQADTVVFVISGEKTTDEDRRDMRLHLNTVHERFGALHLVTTGKMGLELEALKWASAREDVRYDEFAAVWALPQPDGTTRRNPNARSPRNAKLRQFCEQAVAAGRRVLVFCYGTERSNDRVEPLLVRAGAWPLRTSSLYDARRHSIPAAAPAVPEDMGPEATGAPGEQVVDELQDPADCSATAEALVDAGAQLGLDPEDVAAAVGG